MLAEIQAIEGLEVTRTFIHPPVSVSRTNSFVRALGEAVSKAVQGEKLSVGRDGASDAAAFLAAGIPAVEFGPAGGGHHGPGEWVSVSSLARYRRVLTEFVRSLPIHLQEPGPDGTLRAIDGGLG